MIRLVRHAESILNKAGIQYGYLDPELSIEGIAQAVGLALKMLPDKDITDPIYTSPLIRATQTAEIINQIVFNGQHPYITVSGLQERNMGAAEGITKSLAKEWWGDNPPGSESREEVKTRAQKALETIPEGSTVITHSGIIYALTGLKVRPAEAVTLLL